MVIQLVAGLPLVLFGYFFLSIWVGPEYARHSLLPMRMLVLANMIRNICLPYCGMVLGVGLQRYATLSGICEALVNLGSSIVLGKAYGAVGVAAGTIIGAVVGVFFHFLLSMKKTQVAFKISAQELLVRSVLRPALVALPTLALFPLFWRPSNVKFTFPIACVWFALTVGTLWLVGLKNDERKLILSKLGD